MTRCTEVRWWHPSNYPLTCLLHDVAEQRLAQFAVPTPAWGASRGHTVGVRLPGSPTATF
jgi:hypothetical protein